jgi:hypothetical protein
VDSRELGPILMENLVGKVLSPPPPAAVLVRLAGEFHSPSRF